MNKLSENRIKELHNICISLEYYQINNKLFNELALFHDELSDSIDSILKDNIGYDFLPLEEYNYSGKINF
jgi:hypothetical protein